MSEEDEKFMAASGIMDDVQNCYEKHKEELFDNVPKNPACDTNNDA